MTAEDLVYVKTELNKSREELLEVIVILRKEAVENEIYRIENSRAITAMAKDFQTLKAKAELLHNENEELKAALIHLSDINKLKTINIYGRGTERLNDIMAAPAGVDEIDEETAEIIDFTDIVVKKFNTVSKQVVEGSSKKGRKKTGKRKEDFSKLPQKQKFLLDIESLNEQYGAGNWRIAFWNRHTTIQNNPATVYALNTYTPVISIGLEHELVTVPYDGALLKRSFASPSIAAEIIYQKYFLAVPLYRQEMSFADFGLNLSRQTMCNWVIRFASDFFGPVYDYLQEQLLAVAYHQCDETTLLVNKDGRSAGSKSYVWVHITSELMDVNPIILFSYELTRGTDHLRRFYEDFEGFITCDAYCAYQVLEKEKQSVITVCGCMMHMRRRYTQSLSLIDKSGLDADTLLQLTETQALIFIGKIYDADEQLKTLTSQERKEKRGTIVKPLVKEYYDYIESLDINNPLMSKRLKDAINYSLNQKEHLCRFLNDGNIPIDDGATERHIRPFAIGRNNFLFCDSIAGAESTAILYTMVETAKANHANVYWYLRYVLEEMPKHMEDTGRGFLKTMTPWSEEYREYEKQHTSLLKCELDTNEYSSPPRPPRKSDYKSDNTAAAEVA